MFRYFILLVAAFVVVAGSVTAASAGSTLGNGFAWVNDHDGDGIPNGQDEDWIRPLDGSGYKLRHGFGIMAPKAGPSASGSSFQYRYQNRNRSGAGTQAGTCPLTVRLRLRDGSCR